MGFTGSVKTHRKGVLRSHSLGNGEGLEQQRGSHSHPCMNNNYKAIIICVLNACKNCYKHHRSRAIAHFKSKSWIKLMYLPSRGAKVKDSRKDQGRKGEKGRT